MTKYCDMTLEQKQAYLNDMSPASTTPIGVANYCVDIGRQLGKTTQLINSIPASGYCMILALSIGHANMIMRTLREQRPEVDYRNINVLSYANPKWREEAYQANRGLNPKRPIYIDNAVLDLQTLEFVKGIQPR